MNEHKHAEAERKEIIRQSAATIRRPPPAARDKEKSQTNRVIIRR